MKLFAPPKKDLARPFLTTYDPSFLKSIADSARRHLAFQIPGSIINKKGQFLATQDGLEVMQKTGQVVSFLAKASDEIRLPTTLRERETFGRVLADQFIGNAPRLLVFAPACPDYGEGMMFHSQIGPGISAEAQAAISGSQVLLEAFHHAGALIDIQIVIANTETDHPEILEKCAAGNEDFYLLQCDKTVETIRKKVSGLPEIRVNTFTDIFATTFHEIQHNYEALMQNLFNNDASFRAEVESISSERKTRHAQILGRDEKDGELAIRYMAQYAALGSLGRKAGRPVIFLNYDTPNLEYYNAGFRKNIGLSEIDKEPVVVLKSIRK